MAVSFWNDEHQTPPAIDGTGLAQANCRKTGPAGTIPVLQMDLLAQIERLENMRYALASQLPATTRALRSIVDTPPWVTTAGPTQDTTAALRKLRSLRDQISEVERRLRCAHDSLRRQERIEPA